MFSTTLTATPAPLTRRNRVSSIALWTLQVAIAGLFLLAGGSKLAGTPEMVALFNAIGIGQWFRYATGLIEATSAAALLWPPTAPFGALALTATMIGALGAHLFVVGGSPALPTALLVGSAIVAWARRQQLGVLLTNYFEAGRSSRKGR